MRRWIGFACAAVVLCAAAWYFGRPNKAPVASPTTVAAVSPATVESPPSPPPKVLDVIDLARAYEPVPEPEQVLPGGIDPATFIEEPSAPARIPPAFDEDNPYADLLRTVQETYWRGIRDDPSGERIELMPRVVPQPRQPMDDPGFSGIGSGRVQNLLHFFEDPPAVRLDIMPRNVTSDLEPIRELYGYRGDVPRPLLIKGGTVSPAPSNETPRGMSAWQESLAAWLIGSWSGPMTCPKLIPVAPAGDDR